MNNIIDISRLNIGDSVQFSYNHYGLLHYNEYERVHDGTIIAIYINGDRCIGWKNPDDNQITSSNVIAHSTRGSFLICDCSVMDKEDFLDYKYGIWAPAKTIVKHIPEVIVGIVLFPNQKCIGCDLPAPHAKPNDGDNFVCSTCKFLASL